MLRLTFIFFCLVLSAFPVHAADNADAYYRRAFNALDKGKLNLVETYAERGSDTVLSKVLQGYAMAAPESGYSFGRISAFISKNPAWPGLRSIRAAAEKKMPDNLPLPQIVSWFSQYPPITLEGFYRYADAMNRLGFADNAQKAVRARWIEGNLNAKEQDDFYARFSSLLSAEDIKARVDRLLWKNERTLARRLFSHLSETDKALAEARIYVASKKEIPDSVEERLPPDAENDAGILYQRLQQCVKNNDNDDAYEILLNAPDNLGNPEAWWAQRHIMARRAIEDHEYTLAYRLASHHGQTTPRSLVHAEFLSGWLALRYLDKPDDALRHFQNLYDNASTPISRARGAYWMGRANEALGQKDAAVQAYSDAAVFSTTYYGQLALARLQESPVLVARADPPPSEISRSSFFAQDHIRAIERLSAIDEDRRAAAFFRAALEVTSRREDFIMLTEVASRIRRPDLGIQTVKAANQKNILVQNGGFPIISAHIPAQPEPALTHALIRQESMFNPDAASAAGARGLMQVMPRTAREICRRLGLRYKEGELDNPFYNLQIGTAFATRQIGQFDGSYILALAGYNAGPKRVKEWIEEFGDPRDTDVDPIDWIEQIPVSETRNYVQRIMESLQVYRSKLAGGQAPLLIINDLKR